jgi:hypothetical protein
MEHPAFPRDCTSEVNCGPIDRFASARYLNLNAADFACPTYLDARNDRRTLTGLQACPPREWGRVGRGPGRIRRHRAYADGRDDRYVGILHRQR